MVTITYNGHACFTLEADGYRTVIDPYLHGMVDGLPNLSLDAEAVYCSHDHDDHGFRQAVTLCQTEKNAPYTVESIESSHDAQGGKLRGMNWVRIFHFGDLSIAHLGDLGCVPEGNLLEKLQNVDCLLIPVGGTYTINPAEAKKTMELVGPRVVVPMHYRTDSTGFDVLAHIDDFTKQFAHVNSCNNSFTLTKNTPKQILVVNYKP